MLQPGFACQARERLHKTAANEGSPRWAEPFNRVIDSSLCTSSRGRRRSVSSPRQTPRPRGEGGGGGGRTRTDPCAMLRVGAQASVNQQLAAEGRFGHLAVSRKIVQKSCVQACANHRCLFGDQTGSSPVGSAILFQRRIRLSEPQQSGLHYACITVIRIRGTRTWSGD